jgi:uncharacterized Zn finger protein
MLLAGRAMGRAVCRGPDIANPCRHIAATLYILAEAFDADPFLILAWRGRPRKELLDRLRELRSHAVSERLAAGEGDTALAETPVEEVPSLEASIDNFWSAGPLPPAIAPDLDSPADALLRELGLSTVTVDRLDLSDRLVDLYARFVGRARERLEGERLADWTQS